MSKKRYLNARALAVVLSAGMAVSGTPISALAGDPVEKTTVETTKRNETAPTEAEPKETPTEAEPKEEPTEEEPKEEPTEAETKEEPTEAEVKEEPTEAEVKEEPTEEESKEEPTEEESTEEESKEEPTEEESKEEPTEAESKEEPTEAESKEEPTEAETKKAQTETTEAQPETEIAVGQAGAALLGAATMNAAVEITAATAENKNLTAAADLFAALPKAEEITADQTKEELETISEQIGEAFEAYDRLTEAEQETFETEHESLIPDARALQTAVENAWKALEEAASGKTYDEVVELFKALPDASVVTDETTDDEKQKLFDEVLTPAMEAYAALTEEDQARFEEEHGELLEQAFALNDSLIGNAAVTFAQPKPTVGNVTVNGKIGTAISDTYVTFTLPTTLKCTFKNNIPPAAGTSFDDWVDNLPSGLSASYLTYTTRGTCLDTITIKISGTPTEAKKEQMSFSLGHGMLYIENIPVVVPDTPVESNSNANWNIVDPGYVYDSATNTLTIKKDEAKWKDDEGFTEADVKHIIVESGVTKLDDNMFRSCENAEDVSLPDTLTEIGDTAFQFCNKLETIEIPNSVTTIGNWAFSGSGLTSIVLPNTLATIGTRVFYRCPALVSVTIPDSVTSIGLAAFLDCTSLTRITLPGALNSIGEDAFKRCSELTSITIPSSVETIGREAFYGAGKLDSITFLGDIPNIRGQVFGEAAASGIVKVPEGKESAYQTALTEAGLTFSETKWKIEKAVEATAAISDVTIAGTVGSKLEDYKVTVTITGDTFKAFTAYGDPLVRALITNLPAGTKSFAVNNINVGDTSVTLNIVKDGTLTEASDQPIEVVIPGALLTGGKDVTVTVNPNAKWNIVDAGRPSSGTYSLDLITADASIKTKVTGEITFTPAQGKMGVYQTIYRDGILTNKRTAYNNSSIGEGTLVVYDAEYTVIEGADGKEVIIYLTTKQGGYLVTVINGLGGKKYTKGTFVSIVANTPAAGKKFKEWTTSDGVTFADSTSATTYFIMPDKAVTVTATYENTSGGGSSGNGGESSSSSGGKHNVADSTSAHWSQNQQTWNYVKSNGSLARNEWQQLAYNGSTHWYHFGENGSLDTGWLRAADSFWYYLNVNADGTRGAMQTGWFTDPQDGHRYYLDPATGKMATGRTVIDGVEYYFNETVNQYSGWHLDAAGEWAYDAQNILPLGALVTGK